MASQFPTRRFSGAGASKIEVAAIRDEFERSDISIQRGMIDHFKSLSTSAIREYLDNWRARNEPVETPAVTESAPDAPESEATPEATDTPDEDDEDESGQPDPEGDESDATE